MITIDDDDDYYYYGGGPARGWPLGHPASLCDRSDLSGVWGLVYRGFLLERGCGARELGLSRKFSLGSPVVLEPVLLHVN